MKRAFIFLALTLALASTGCNTCNTCRPRWFGGWFNRGDCCDNGCGGYAGGDWMGAGVGDSSTCTNCSNHVPGDAGWVPAGGGNVNYGYIPEEIPNPSRIGPQN